jgi:cytochrome P450
MVQQRYFPDIFMEGLRKSTSKLSGLSIREAVLEQRVEWAYQSICVLTLRADEFTAVCVIVLSRYADMQLVSLCLDLFMAGSETTSNTLGFAVLYMLLHPDVQRRAQDELDSVVGRSNQPLLQHRPRYALPETRNVTGL